MSLGLKIIGRYYGPYQNENIFWEDFEGSINVNFILKDTSNKHCEKLHGRGSPIAAESHLKMEISYYDVTMQKVAPCTLMDMGSPRKLDCMNWEASWPVSPGRTLISQSEEL